MSDVDVGSKRNNDDNGDRYNKRFRNDRDKMRFLLVGKHCGAIIGKGGENIKRLRNDYNVGMHLPDVQSRERVLSIQGDKGSCVGVLREILASCKEAPYVADQRKKLNYEINYLVNSDQVGAIIGKGGEQIREIDEQSGGKVKVYPDCLPNSNERVIAIGGDDESCLLSAVNIVLDLLEKRPAKRSTNYYDPKNKHSDDMMHDGGNQMGGGSQMRGGNQLGGFGNGLGGLGGLGNLSDLAAGAATLLNSLGVNPAASAALLGGTMGGLPNMQGNSQNMFGNLDNRGGHPPQDFGPGPDRGYDMDRSNRRVDDGFTNRDSRRGDRDRDDRDGEEFGQMKTEVNITVTNDMAGAIIGKSGQRVKDIRFQTGVKIDFSKTERNSKEDRVLTITGTQQQTVAAQRMMADFVKNRHE